MDDMYYKEEFDIRKKSILYRDRSFNILGGFREYREKCFRNYLSYIEVGFQ